MTKRRAESFENPILPGFYPDPSICRVGEDFYVVTSSFEYFPGIPILHSRDLVHFRQIGHVLSRPSQLQLAGVRSSGGIYAPTLRFHRGRFYVVCTNVDAGGNFIVTARRPEGPWSEPRWIDKEGFDPSLLFDGDVVYYSRDGKGPDFDHPLVYQTQIDVTTGKLRNKPKPIYAGTGGVWPEASHLYRVGSWYYLVIAEGGTAYDHSVVVARSRKPMGPFEPCPRNPVLTHRDRQRDAFQALGHADLVDTPQGDYYAVLLGIRPKRGRFHHLGRETFLAPVTWGSDGWPIFGRHGRLPGVLPFPALPKHAFPRLPARDDFDTDKLRHEYVFVRNPLPKSYSLTAQPGMLRLRGLASDLSDTMPKAFVGRRQTDFDCRCRTSLSFEPLAMSDEAGLVVRSSELFHYSLVVRRSSLTDISAREAQLWATVAGKLRLIGRVPVGRGPVLLEVLANASEYRFSAGSGRRMAAVGVLATKQLSAEVGTATGPGMCFTGVVIGMYASGRGQAAATHADFDWFEYKADRNDRATR